MLHKLNISVAECDITDQNMTQISESLMKFNALESLGLNFKNNILGEQGSVFLAMALPNLHNLKELKLSLTGMTLNNMLFVFICDEISRNSSIEDISLFFSQNHA